MSDRDYSYAEAADLLGVKESFLKHAVQKLNLPHHKYSLTGSGLRGTVTFSAAHLEQIRKAFEKNTTQVVHPTLQPTGRRRA